MPRTRAELAAIWQPTAEASLEAGPKPMSPCKTIGATALTHRLLADKTLRQALVEPIIHNIAAGSIATVVHHRRGAE